MLVNDKSAQARLNSPNNLINRLNTAKSSSRKSAMSLFMPSRKEVSSVSGNISSVLSAIAGVKHPVENTSFFNPFNQPLTQIDNSPIASAEPVLEQLLENHESQIKLGLAHDKALELLNNSVSILSAKLDDVSASKLPQVITAASKVVDQIRRERNEVAKQGKDREVHFHFYTPEQKKVSDYEVIDIGGA